MYSVRPTTPTDRAAIVAAITASWGGTTVVAHGTLFRVTQLPGLIAERDGRMAGLLTYHIDGDALEIVTIDADPPGSGAGTMLIAAVQALAWERNLAKVWLITTNDNLGALRFYQRRGFRIVDVSPGAVDRSRKMKPSIPTIGAYGIPIRDELTLELVLGEPGSDPHVDALASKGHAFGGK
jgi:N-acetylglutamate synthase-like GNAT family acetyltransferase